MAADESRSLVEARRSCVRARGGFDAATRENRFAGATVSRTRAGGPARIRAAAAPWSKRLRSIDVNRGGPDRCWRRAIGAESRR